LPLIIAICYAFIVYAAGRCRLFSPLLLAEDTPGLPPAVWLASGYGWLRRLAVQAKVIRRARYCSLRCQRFASYAITPGAAMAGAHVFNIAAGCRRRFCRR